MWDGDALAHAIEVRGDVVEVRTFCFEDGSFEPWAQGEDVPDGYGGRSKRWAYFVNDPNGTPDELVDATGSVVAELERDAWGKATAASAATPLRFQGQYHDAATATRRTPSGGSTRWGSRPRR